jgi:hypothetical protein
MLRFHSGLQKVLVWQRWHESAKADRFRVK